MDILGFIVKICFAFYNSIFAIGSILVNGYYTTDLMQHNMFYELLVNMNINPVLIPELPPIVGSDIVTYGKSLLNWALVFIQGSPLIAIISFASYIGVAFLIVKLFSKFARAIKDLANPLN